MLPLRFNYYFVFILCFSLKAHYKKCSQLLAKIQRKSQIREFFTMFFSLIKQKQQFL
jgi:hypothetical protein